MDANKRWMASGKIGCTFASYFAKHPDRASWSTYRYDNLPAAYNPYTCIVSIQFPDKDIAFVRAWALTHGFYEEHIEDQAVGLRAKVGKDVAWVQYFGPDSHVLTRQAPIPELMFCLRLPFKSYVKVGWKGVLHLAHASVDSIKDTVADRLWRSSFSHTKKILGHQPTIKEAAKTTWLL